MLGGGDAGRSAHAGGGSTAVSVSVSMPAFKPGAIRAEVEEALLRGRTMLQQKRQKMIQAGEQSGNALVPLKTRVWPPNEAQK